MSEGYYITEDGQALTIRGFGTVCDFPNVVAVKIGERMAWVDPPKSIKERIKELEERIEKLERLQNGKVA